MSSGILTALAMLAFVGVVVWVFGFKKREDFDRQANLPLDEDRRNDQDEEEKS